MGERSAPIVAHEEALPAAGAVAADWLAGRAARTPGATAIEADGRAWSWAEFDRQASRVAAELRRRGVAEGSRVAVALPAGLGWVTLFHACLRLRAVCVPLNTRLASGELRRLLDWLDPDAVFGLPWAGRRRRRRRETAGAGVAAIVATSGTTGRPKGVLLTRANFWWNAVASALHLGFVPGERWLAVLPLFHVGGLALLTRSVLLGTTVLLRRRFEPGEVNRLIDAGRVQALSLVATMLERLLEARGERPFPPTLRFALVGGGPVPRPLLERAEALACPVLATYGMTETASQVVTVPPVPGAAHPGSAGRPLPFAEVAVVDEELRPVPAGTLGEIALRGPTVAAGYWRDPGATRRVFVRGWLRTGDLGYLDEDGCLFVVGRSDDLIISGGEKIAPAEVEEALLAHPAVRDAGVWGVPDPLWGERPRAAVVLRPGAGLDAGALRSWLRERIAHFKVPDRIDFVTRLPRTASGKLQRRLLAAGAVPDREG
ncbi:MAG: AMP-binding protein [Bacillota bacterium]|nr:AMP-binding protein [Bacillota bacterium]